MLKFQEGLSQLGQDRPHVWLSRALESQLCSDLGIWGREAGIGVGNTGKAKGCSEVGVLTANCETKSYLLKQVETSNDVPNRDGLMRTQPLTYPP